MNDNKANKLDTQNVSNDSVKKAWTAPEMVDYDYASLTQGGANLRTTDDTAGDNYRVS